MSDVMHKVANAVGAATYYRNKEIARAAIEAYLDYLAEEGFKIVPRSPTREMLSQARGTPAFDCLSREESGEAIGYIWFEMLDQAPPPPT